MSNETARALFLQAQAAIASGLRELDTLPTPPGPVGGITSIDAFERVLALAKPGEVITLAPSFVYKTPLKLTKPVTIRSVMSGAGRMTLDAPAPSFKAGIAVPGGNVTLLGLEVTDVDRTKTLVDITGASCTVDRCRVLGGAMSGQKRGIAMNGSGAMVVRCYVEDCFGPYPGDDCQAICAWDTPGPLLIEDCYLSGSTETLMIGGADPSSADRIPSDITIKHCTITKRPAWQAMPISVKNTIELKNARRVRIEDNDISQSWGGHGQTGVLCMLTVRNQNGRVSESTIQDVVITNNRFSHGAAAVSILALDNTQLSTRMARVAITDNTFTALDATAYTGSAKIVQIDAAPEDLTIEGNTFAGTNMTSGIYFAGGKGTKNLRVRNNRFPAGLKYGLVFGSGSRAGLDPAGVPWAWTDYVASGEWSGNTET